MRQSQEALLGDLATYFFYMIIGIFFIFPILWSFSVALGSQESVLFDGLRIFPKNPTLENFKSVLAFPFFDLYLWNALKLSFFGALGASLICLPSAYAFSRFDWKGRKTALILILVFKMFSGIIILVPLYRYLRMLGLLNSHLVVICVYIGVQIPMTTWLLKGFCDKVPKSLEESAMIDGCSRLGAVFRVVLPTLISGFMAAFIINIITNWGTFIIPFILLSKAKLLPIAVGLLKFQNDYEGGGQELVAAASVLSILPAIIIFVLLQRLIIKSMTTGAVKG